MAIATVREVKKYAREHKLKIRKFSDGIERLVCYKAVRRGGYPWGDNHQPAGYAQGPYLPSTNVIASGLSLGPYSCSTGLHVTTLKEAVLWVMRRCRRYWQGYADEIVEVFVPIKQNIVIPTEQPLSDEDQSKIRCRSLYVNRVVPAEEWPK